ncbi:MAG: S41 family peptidase [Ignavibacteria bacterium]|nr:S41 family peptidase [Ignavibacteria bacterium]
MNTRSKIILYILTVLTFAGCAETFLGPDPENSPQVNFSIFWNDFNRNYAQFPLKDLDWDSVYTFYYPEINSNTSQSRLFSIFREIVINLNDMHVNLYTPLGIVSRNSAYPAAYPSMRLINSCKYLKCGQSQNSVMEYRDCQNADFGYILIPSFSGDGDNLSFLDRRYDIIDNILSCFREKKGLIIDLRSNTGGNVFNAEYVAGRFTEESIVYAKYKEKIGPDRNDFSEWRVSTINPAGSQKYHNPIVLLTSRSTASSAEMFVLAMRTLPNVTIIGDTTGGGVGSPVYRELPNGWTFRLSTRFYSDVAGRIIEGNGIIPDIAVQTTMADSANGVDKILEKGIEFLVRHK